MTTASVSTNGRGTATSHGHLLELIRERDGLSRQQLMSLTGMSRGTLYGRLERLAEHDLVYEAEPLERTGGRRSRRIRFNDRGRVVLALDLGQTHARVAVLDISGSERRARTVRLEINQQPERVFAPLLALAQTLLAEHPETSSQDPAAEVLIGVGVAVPAPVDVLTGLASHPTTIPRWAPDAVLQSVGQRWAVPLVVENDARASAVGESRDSETLVYVKVATGIGCGVVTAGAVQRGAYGAAGDIGHILLDETGPRCRCGRRGCLAAFSSGAALLDELGGGPGTLDGLVAAAAAGDPDVLAALGRAGDQLGRALAATLAALNPHRLVIGGILGRVPALVEPLETRVRRDVADRVVDRLVIEGSTLGETAGTRGLARLVVERVYAPDAVDALLDAQGSGR